MCIDSSVSCSWTPFSECSALIWRLKLRSLGDTRKIYGRRPLTQPENSSSYLALPCLPQRTYFTASLSAQRNVYLTGFCLFLSLVLTRTFYIIQDLIDTQDEYAKLKKAVRPRLFLSFDSHTSLIRTSRPPAVHGIT